VARSLQPREVHRQHDTGRGSAALPAWATRALSPRHYHLFGWIARIGPETSRKMLTTEEDFTRAAREHGISLDPRKPRRLDVSGTDFLVFHGTDEDGTPWILRSPRRADVL